MKSCRYCVTSGLISSHPISPHRLPEVCGCGGALGNAPLDLSGPPGSPWALLGPWAPIPPGGLLMQDKWGGSKWGVQVCWLGTETQGTPNHTFLSPIGSPSNRFAHSPRGNMQNSGADVAR